MGALIGALGVETLLRWPSIAFHGFTAAVAGVVLVPLFVSAYRRFSSENGGEPGWLLAVTVLAVGFSVPLAAGGILDEHGDLGRTTTPPNPPSEDVTEWERRLGDYQASNCHAPISRMPPRGSRAGGRQSPVVPVIAQQRQALATGAATARDLVAVAARQAPSFDYQERRLPQGPGRSRTYQRHARSGESIWTASLAMARDQSRRPEKPLAGRADPVSLADLRRGSGPCQVEHRPGGESDPRGP